MGKLSANNVLPVFNFWQKRTDQIQQKDFCLWLVVSLYDCDYQILS